MQLLFFLNKSLNFSEIHAEMFMGIWDLIQNNTGGGSG